MTETRHDKWPLLRDSSVSTRIRVTEQGGTLAVHMAIGILRFS